MTNLCGKGVISQGRPITCPTSVRFRLPHPMSYLSTTESHRTEAPEERGLTSINGPMADLLKPRALSTSRDRASNAEQPRSERTAADVNGEVAGAHPAPGEYVVHQARRPAGADATGRRQFKKEA